MASNDLIELSRSLPARKLTLGGLTRKNKVAPIIAGILAVSIVGGLIAIPFLLSNPPQQVIVHSDVPRPPVNPPATDDPKPAGLPAGLPSVTTDVQPINDPTAAPSITGSSAPVPERNSTIITTPAPIENVPHAAAPTPKSEDTFFGMPIPSSVEKR